MKPPSRPADAAQRLRVRAERKVRTIELREAEALTTDDTRRLLHELRVHQIELEMQNEELRVAQADLEASRARFFDLYDLAPVGYLSLDHQGIVIESNLRAASLLGAPRGYLTNKPLLRFVQPEWQGFFLTHYRELLALGAPQLLELQLRPEQGEPFWARLEAVAHRDEESVGVCRLAVTDIGAWKRVEQSLRASEERTERLLRVLPTAVYASDARGEFTFFNDSAEHLWGRAPAPGETVEQFERSFSFFRPDGTPCEYRETPMAIAARDRRPLHDADVAVQRTDGSIADWLMNIDPLRQLDSQREGRIYAFVDQTERKRVARELDRSVRELERADRQKDEFIAVLSHELRNPLAPIRSAVEVMRLSQIEDPTLARCRELIERQVGQLVRLLDDLLDISRIARGRLEVRRSVVTLASICEMAVETSAPALADGKHPLETSLPDEPVRLDVDGARVAQVISNLLNNAAHYSDPGTAIDLRARCEKGPAGDEVLIQVADRGIGMTSEEIGLVFGLFTQGAASTRERNPHGLGIGLALAKSIIELHGGSISAESAGPNLGSEFTIRLPTHG